MQFTKQDFWRAVIIGEAIALLSLPILKNIKVFELIAQAERTLSFLIIWLILVPALSASGLYLAYLLSKKWSFVFEVAKYGLVGWLNTFLSAGIFNFLVLITGVAQGWQATVFLIISNGLTISQSFFWNKYWTFELKQTKKTGFEYVKYAGLTGATSLLIVFLFHIFVNVIGAPSGIDQRIWNNIALAILIPVAVAGNFLGCKLWVFKKKSALRITNPDQSERIYE